MVKLDMAMTDPVDGSGVCALRHLMLSQRSLVPLLRLIIGNMSLLELHMYKVRWDYVVPTDLAPMGYSVLGVPALTALATGSLRLRSGRERTWRHPVNCHDRGRAHPEREFGILISERDADRKALREGPAPSASM